MESTQKLVGFYQDQINILQIEIQFNGSVLLFHNEITFCWLVLYSRCPVRIESTKY